MVKIEPLQLSRPANSSDFFEYVRKEYGFEETDFGDIPSDIRSSLSDEFNRFWSEKESMILRSYIEENFDGDWRMGKEICKVVLTQKFYQTSPNSTQA